MIQDSDLTVWRTSEMAHLTEAINSLITVLDTPKDSSSNTQLGIFVYQCTCSNLTNKVPFLLDSFTLNHQA